MSSIYRISNLVHVPSSKFSRRPVMMEKSPRFLKNAADDACVIFHPRMSGPNAEYENYEDQYTTEGGNADAEPDFIVFGPRSAIFW